MNCSQIFETIDLLGEEYVKIWEDICNIESPSLYKAGVDAVGEYLSEYAKGLGYKIERFPEEKFGDVVCLTMNADSKMAPIALSGHMDTVHPIGLFGTPAVRRENDKIYGPGVVDCKGGIVAGLLAMHALKACGYTERPVMMLLQSNEEIGSGLMNKGPLRNICEKARDAVAFLNLEGYESYYEGKATLERKGNAAFLFHVKGISAHASYCAREGASAIREAALKIAELEKIKEDGGLTFNVGVIRGGSVRNSIPADCEFELDVRFSNDEELSRAKEIINRVANTTYVGGCSCEVENTNLRVAMVRSEKNTKLLESANRAFEKNGLSTLEAGRRNGASDAADVTAFGIPCMDSIGVEGERAHSVDEYATIPSLMVSAKRIAAIVCEL